MMLRVATRHHSIMKRQHIDAQLRQSLGHHLAALIQGWPRPEAAVLLNFTMSEISQLRLGRCARFSIGRLIFAIIRRHYDVEVHFKRIPRPYARPRRSPTATVHFDPPIPARPAPAPPAAHYPWRVFLQRSRGALAPRAFARTPPAFLAPAHN